ncbi:hypothetical protein DPMN_021202 [Dreissena polymorpha]|uniref:Uncharacterized protein n=1 Tax=Dreissena polymorpha TaxID=45954 RepID=A0A9D4NI59_DREPO|nr:hypothetical protein DPMN_021202 [Dreissena polymorpha]
MIAGSLFSELSVVEIKKASAAPRECVSTVVCYQISMKCVASVLVHYTLSEHLRAKRDCRRAAYQNYVRRCPKPISRLLVNVRISSREIRMEYIGTQ